MKYITPLCLLAFFLLLPGCTTHHENTASPVVIRTAELKVPTGYDWLTMVPATYDPWVYQQDDRRLFTLIGTGIAAGPGEIYVLDEPVEFHVGNELFFSDVLGMSGKSLEEELNIVLDPEDGSPPFVLTTPMQHVKTDSISVPPGFDGWAVFQRTDGIESEMCREVTVKIRRVAHPDV
ncbi:MAG: hypothetical protein R3336_01815, partial [Phycisphaeraceae bacterium]|nr:hypothetical protein [Phycisphaeraceae bacterium]